MTMQWKRSSETSMRCAPWTVAKVTLSGTTKYELWHDKQKEQIGLFGSFDKAKAEAERVEMGDVA